MRRIHRTGWQRRALTLVAAAGLGGFLALIVTSPRLLGSLIGRSEDWHQLSEVGQAYGGISAILSGLAFCGIAGSLLLQWRQVRLTQTMVLRQRHFELSMIAIDDPRMAVPLQAGKPDVEARRLMVLNQWVAYWSTLWEIGNIDPPTLRSLFDGVFREDLAMDWWSVEGANWFASPRLTKRQQHFLTIASEAYQARLVSRPAKTTAVPAPARQPVDLEFAVRSRFLSFRVKLVSPGRSAPVLPGRMRSRSRGSRPRG
ncbi:hypothetical protein JIG36_38055 [Actinoplanes sp. LDG1-06]|uniref:Uncharacterized protein n=1 Tax=Paractinoplanes ovalisporus TaxID=2810368 RepID=A0ABS2AN97_9ACTN|nr:DUF6082 family protein [Actinoplanes ovalisporus]MBM2621322.1 hypothetical protein [Actinoplanes ovalisporus]